MIVKKNKITFPKTNKSTGRVVDEGINKLKKRLTTYSSAGMVDVFKIFNDDILIHDIICKKFYVYKCRVDKVQLRILYTITEGQELTIISFYIKKADTKKYIHEFENICKKL